MFWKKKKIENPQVPLVKVTLICGNCKHEWEHKCREGAFDDVRYRVKCPICKYFAGAPKETA